MIYSPVPLDDFITCAKDLQSRVRAEDPEACARVRAAFPEPSARSDSEQGDLDLMRAQQVVAVEHGFASWKALTKASGIEARLALTMARHPELNDAGMGRDPGSDDLVDAAKDAVHAESRRSLRASARAVATTVTWLCENVEPMRTINQRHTSYGIKHMAEDDIGYVTNGVFIAAGIVAGYPYRVDPDSTNVLFGMSEKSLKMVLERRTSPQRLLRRFTARAVEILAERGVQAFPAGRSGIELVWRDEGCVRTLRIGAIMTAPFIVRLHVDHYGMFVSQKVAKAIGVSGLPFYTTAYPTRPKAEINLLLDEVEPALEWALHHNAWVNAKPPPPPFEVAGPDTWSYVWSLRASDRYAARPKWAKAA